MRETQPNEWRRSTNFEVTFLLFDLRMRFCTCIQQMRHFFDHVEILFEA